MGKYSYDSYSKMEAGTPAAPKKEFPRVGYFYLSDDKTTAIVRFDVSSGEDLVIADVHNVKVGDRWRNVACLRDSDSEPWNKCPLCEHNIKTRSTKVFVRMLEYVYEDNKVVAKPVVWTRYKGFADELIRDLNDYGDLRDCLFKVTRIKENGKTSYDVKYQPDKGIYTEEAGYVKDFSAFKNFMVNKHSFMERTFDELKAFVETGEMASRKPAEKSSIESTPVTAPAPTTSTAVEKPVITTSEVPTHPAYEDVAPVFGTEPAEEVSKPEVKDNPLESRRRRYNFD